MHRLFLILSLIYLSCNSTDVDKTTSISKSDLPRKFAIFSFTDIIGSWVDKRMVTNISSFSREEIFRPASGFCFYRDSKTKKPTLRIQYYEHFFPFTFDSICFISNTDTDFDSCFSFINGNESFLLLFNKQDSSIKDLKLIDTTYLSQVSQKQKSYSKVSARPLLDIEQFSLGKYLLDSIVEVEYKGVNYNVRVKYKNEESSFYKVQGLPEFEEIQFISWDNKKRLYVSFTRKGNDYFEGMVKKNGQTYFADFALEQLSFKKYKLTRTENLEKDY